MLGQLGLKRDIVHRLIKMRQRSLLHAQIVDPAQYLRQVGMPAEGEYDTLCGDRAAAVGTYREFVSYSRSNVLPEFSILYTREY